MYIMYIRILCHSIIAVLTGTTANGIGAAGVRELEEGLRVNKTLTSLSIAGNRMLPMGTRHTAIISNSQPGAASLANALKENSSIVSLNIWGNVICPEGLNSLAPFLKHSPVLSKLNLKGNNLREEGAKTLADILKTNKNLTMLDISGDYTIPTGDIVDMSDM
jgi:hypothetical protein